MKVYKKYGLEDRSYRNTWLDNIELKSIGVGRQKINDGYAREIKQPIKGLQIFYQGNVYTYFKEAEAKLGVKLNNSISSDEIARKHLENIRARLEQRLKSAKAKGNRELIYLLEKEKQLT